MKFSQKETIYNARLKTCLPLTVTARITFDDTKCDLRSDVRHAMKIARETENSSDDMTRGLEDRK